MSQIFYMTTPEKLKIVSKGKLNNSFFFFLQHGPQFPLFYLHLTIHYPIRCNFQQWKRVEAAEAFCTFNPQTFWIWQEIT